MEECILTLVRLRLRLLSRHLTDIFGVSEGSVSNVFTTWICFLSTVFRDMLLKWPCKGEIKKKLPSSFNKFPSTRIIIDCTEIFLQKPTSPSAQRATWSNYKQHNNMKALVGITPTGYFSFVLNCGLEMSVTDTSQKEVVYWTNLKRRILLWPTRGSTSEICLQERKLHLISHHFAKVPVQ